VQAEFKTCLIEKTFAHQLKTTIIVMWAAYIKLVAFHHFITWWPPCSRVSIEYKLVNVVFSCSTGIIGMRYTWLMYTSDSLDLRCESVTYTYVYICIQVHTYVTKFWKSRHFIWIYLLLLQQQYYICNHYICRIQCANFWKCVISTLEIHMHKIYQISWVIWSYFPKFSHSCIHTCWIENVQKWAQLNVWNFLE